MGFFSRLGNLARGVVSSSRRGDDETLSEAALQAELRDRPPRVASPRPLRAEPSPAAEPALAGAEEEPVVPADTSVDSDGFRGRTL